MMRALAALACPSLVAIVLASCGSSSGDSAPATRSDASPSDASTATSDCTALSEADGFACAEAAFWKGLGTIALQPRKDAELALSNVIARTPAPSDVRAMAILRFRLGAIRLAMALENGERAYVTTRDLIVGELDRAMALDSYGGIIAPFKDTMLIATAAMLGDWGTATDLANEGFAHIDANRMGNTLSLSGVVMGFPMSTGVPARMIPYLDDWTCTGVAWCTANTAHAPFARPGLEYHFAEAYARVGDRPKATMHLERALAAPGANEWAYRKVAADAAADVGAFIDKFARLGADGSAFAVVYANQPFGCAFCHGRP